jgi:hypothetical protein
MHQAATAKHDAGRSANAGFQEIATSRHWRSPLCLAFFRSG